MRAVLSRLLLLALVFFAQQSLASTGAIPSAWLAQARDARNLETLKTEIDQRKAQIGEQEYLPLALALAEASRAEADPEAAFALATLASEAAPSDALIQWNAARAGLRSTAHLGQAVRHAWTAAGATATDPWLRGALTSRLLLFAGAAAALAALALLAVAIPQAQGLFLHDLSDRFPRNYRRLFPAAALVLGVAVLLAVGAGFLILLYLPAICLGPYMPKRARVALFACLALLPLGFFGLDLAGRMGGLAGERAWAVYRLQKGAAGADLEADLANLFPEKGAKVAYFRAILARRAGNLDAAEALLAQARDGGLPNDLLLGETAGLRFLKGDLAGSAQAYAKVTEAVPGDWEAWYNLSRAETARLELNAGEKALAKAKELNPAALEKRQSRSSVLGGRIYPGFRAFPQAWVAEEMDRYPENRARWPVAFWRILGFSHPLAAPYLLILLAAVGFGYAWSVDPSGLSRRCISCGVEKCPRCHRLVKDINVCGACWALHHEAKKVDATRRQEMKGKITAHTLRSRKLRRYSSYLLPGWPDFFHDASAAGLTLGLFWAASLSLLFVFRAFPFSLLPGLGGSLLAPLALAALAYVAGAASAKRW